VPHGQEIPMSKIKQGVRSSDPAIEKEARFAHNAPRAMTVTATAKSRRREARLDKRVKSKSEKRSLGVKNTFLGKTPKK
jgi:hypothetical protein